MTPTFVCVCVCVCPQQEVARTLGYHGYGLARLTRQVRGKSPSPSPGDGEEVQGVRHGQTARYKVLDAGRR